MRLRNERLIGTPFRRAEDAVRHLGAVQAQDYAAAKWAIGQRVRNCADGDVQQAYIDGKILRTHVMRPTWHFVTPDDIRWLLALTAPRVRAAMAYYDRQLGLDAAAYRRSNRILERALRGGTHQTRTEIGKLLEASGVAASGQRLAHLVMRAELEALVCSGAMRGKQHTYALLDERAPDARMLPRDEALAELTLRYFTGHGPALPRDFAWWSGLTVADAKRGIDMNREHLSHESIDGKPYWFAPSTPPPKIKDPTVHLLPNYDEYLIAFKDHAASFAGPAPARSAALYDMLARHIVVINGMVVGGWRPVAEKDAVRIETKLLVPLGREQQAALRAQAERYGRFIGRRVSLAPQQVRTS
jgi:winged helix DNA-binding protein